MERARETFWEAVQQAAAEMPSYTLQPADVMNRFVAVCSMAADAEAAVGKAEAANHAFTRVTVSRLDDVVRKANTGNGLFYEVAGTGLDALLAWFGDSDQNGRLLWCFQGGVGGVLEPPAAAGHLPDRASGQGAWISPPSGTARSRPLPEPEIRWRFRTRDKFIPGS